MYTQNDHMLKKKKKKKCTRQANTNVAGENSSHVFLHFSPLCVYACVPTDIFP